MALDVFWRQWQTLSEPARVQALAPLSNKLRALLGNRMLRNMLCQAAAPDLGHTITRGRWLLVSLPQTLGEDAADLVGSVLLHRAWQAAQRLGPIATNDRPPFLCLVDECHRFCHLPQGMATALAQARGYGVGFVLAHQHLAQVSDHGLAEAIDANCQTKICFALQAADAKRMAAHFEPRLDAYDLQHLGSYTIACRVLHEARELPAATAATLPPPKPTAGDPAGVIRERARESAHERSAVEAAIRERYGRIEQPPPGRADADQPMQVRSPAGFDDGFAGAGEPIEDECFAEVESSPCVIPFDSPPNGGPPTPGIPHHDTGRWRSGNPDSSVSLLAGAVMLTARVTLRDRELLDRSPSTSPSPPPSYASSSSLVLVPVVRLEAQPAPTPDRSAVVPLPTRPPDDRRERAPAAGTVDP